jgi:GH24 family phage-related lysozyme (muramidase)
MLRGNGQESIKVVDRTSAYPCEDGVATIRWGSTTAKLKGRPTSFKYTSPVITLLNRVPEKNPNAEAAMDRCHNIERAQTNMWGLAI